MFNKEMIIEEYGILVRNLGIKKEDLVLGGGGSLVMHGLRESTADFDFILEPLDFGQALSVLKISPTNKYGTLLISHGFYDFYLNKEESATTIEIEGVVCASLDYIYKQKVKWDRPKDQLDIIKIREILKISNKNYRQHHMVLSILVYFFFILLMMLYLHDLLYLLYHVQLVLL
jgi:hypothetical protein